MLKFCFCVAFSFLGVFLTYGQETEDEGDCECVPYYLCSNGTINTNGVNIIDIRMKVDDCTSYLEICCKKKDRIEEPTIRSPPPPAKSGCGYRNADGIGYRISGNTDNEAEFGEFPWAVAIMHKGETDSKHMYRCGGSLIHPQVVLTAGHCILGVTNLRVRAGEWDTQTTQERFKHQEKKVTSGVVHRDYGHKTLSNDVALLFLESPFNISDSVNVVCLPEQNSIVTSEACFVTGWGKEKFEQAGAYQSILKKIELPTISREKCQNGFRRTRLGQYFNLHRSFMCAGGEEGKDACTGDGGGPLVCPIPGEEDSDRYQQVGIVSWGIGCGTKGVPGAYTDVAYFRDWIDGQMRKKKFSTTIYEI